jgi:Flp pilus assembly protein TadG
MDLDMHSRLSKFRRGAALVEMAIVMPVLLLITLGLIEYGWVFFRISQINQAARQGVRAAVRPDATGTQIESNVASMMNNAGLTHYTLSYSDIAVGVGEPVTVLVAVDYSKLTLTGTSWIPLPSTLKGRATMAKEGPPTGP